MTQTTPTQTLKLLIGDDSFNDNKTIEDFAFLMLCGMNKVTKLAAAGGALKGNVYTCSVPLRQFSRAEITFVDSVDRIIDESSKGYDWIVTDLSYGRDQEEMGLLVIQSICGVRSLKAITSSTASERLCTKLEKLQEIGILDCIVFYFTGQDSDKATELGKVIAKHYMRQR